MTTKTLSKFIGFFTSLSFIFLSIESAYGNCKFVYEIASLHVVMVAICFAPKAIEKIADAWAGRFGKGGKK